MAYDTAPAIRRRYGARDSAVEVTKRVGSDVRFTRGLGESGTVVEEVDVSDAFGGCPLCGNGQMIRSIDKSPVDDDDVVYYCMNYACPHFVGDELRYDASESCRGISRADRSSVWDHTAECPDCGGRHTVEVSFALYTELPDEYDDVLERRCAECDRLEAQ